MGQRTSDDPTLPLAAESERPTLEPPAPAHPALAALARLLARQAAREWLEQQHGECRIVDESPASASIPEQEQVSDEP